MGNVMMEASQINYRGGETKMSVEQALKETSGEAAAIAALQAAVGNLQTGKADLPVIAPEFDAETGVYAVGDLVMYQGKLYEFTTAHETAGDWDSTEVTEKTVSDEIDSLKSGLMSVENDINKLITTSLTYSGVDSYFPIPQGTPGPSATQVSVVARNIANGAIYALWYDASVPCFRVGGIISGDAPTDGNMVYVQYSAIPI